MKALARIFSVFVLAVLFVTSARGLGETSLADVERALAALSLPSEKEIQAAFEVGFSQGRLSPEEALRLLERLAKAQGGAAEEEAILLVIAHALEEDLPVTMLLSKVAEGLARGIPLPVIAQDLSQRERLLAGVRDLLYAKRIFRAQEGMPAVSPSIPGPRFDLLVTHIADALGGYLEGGGSPLEGYLLLKDVTNRLTLLAGSVIPPEDVELVLGRIEAADLTRVARTALDQSKK
jgi:hypothetical protein